jgi:O-glycosyl hydrolase
MTMSRRTILAAALASLTAAPALAADPAVTLPIRVDVEHPGTPFEGWGTALAWFASITGGYPDATRNRLADLFYGQDGLGWTIARYNIGGGNPPGTSGYLRVGGAIPGFWRQPAGTTGNDWWRADDARMWDWSADASQRWWLNAIRVRVKTPIYEAFSNSPPWFMTVSGKVSGAEKATDDNLRPGHEARFASYLARVVEELQRRHGIAFRTLSPVNEPNTDYWFAANKQEGAHWSPARQAMMIDASDAALKARGLKTVVSAPDETSSNLFLEDWAGYPAATRARIGQLNVHSYGTLNQSGVRDAARAANIRLWMSEVDLSADKTVEDFTDIRPALALGERIVGDLKKLEPAAWVFWQAVEDDSARDGKPGSNWGLIKMDLRAPAAGPHRITITPKYWAMANFSRYIKPGMSLVKVDDVDSVAASSADGAEVALVHVNPGWSPRNLVMALPGAWRVETVVTDAGHKAEATGSVQACRTIRAVAPPRGITTLRLVRTATRC